MTRRDYELVASVILETRKIMEGFYLHEESVLIAFTTLDKLEKEMSRALARDNSRFNPETFSKACTI